MISHFDGNQLRNQRGMGATVVPFTIALIILVGLALAYASRNSAPSVSSEGAKVYSAVMLKQSADYRDAYNRFVFDGGNAASMTFNASGLPAGDLFFPSTQYGVYQLPPAQVVTNGATPAWNYNPSVFVNGIGTASGPESIVYVPNLTQAVCAQINNQMYGSTTIPVVGIASSALATPGSVLDSGAAYSGRSTGCVATSDARYVFYSTLAES